MTTTAQTTTAPRRTVSRPLACKLLGVTEAWFDHVAGDLDHHPGKRSTAQRYALADIMALRERLAAAPPRRPTT